MCVCVCVCVCVFVFVCGDQCEQLLQMSSDKFIHYNCLNNCHGLWRMEVTFFCICYDYVV